MEMKKIRSTPFMCLIGAVGGLLISYLMIQFFFFKDDFEKNFQKELYSAESYIQNVLKNYELILHEISREIKVANDFSRTSIISDVLKRAYVYGVETEEEHRVHALGINWIGIGGGDSVSRFGKMKHSLEFQRSYLEKLEETPEKLVISNNFEDASDPNHQIVNFGMGIRDNKENFKGFINARVDVAKLMDKLNSSKGMSDIGYILLDDKLKVITSSVSLTRKEEKDIESFVGNKGILLEKIGKRYSFSTQFPINGFPYFILATYDSNLLYSKFFDYIKYDMILLFVISLLFIISMLYFHKYIIKKSLLKLECVLRENKQHIENNVKLEKYIRSFEESDKERHKFNLEVNRRISSSLSDMLDLGRDLLEKVERNQGKESNPKELLNVFEKAYLHSRGICVKKEETNIDIGNEVDEALKILSKELYKKNIHVRKQMEEDKTTLFTDELSIRQLILNILIRSINNSPKEGKIDIKVSSQTEHICLECVDNGYDTVTEETLAEIQDERARSFDIMFLDWKDLEILAKSLGASFSTKHQPYIGNFLTLKVPYKSKKSLSYRGRTREENESNIIRFSHLKKNGSN